MTLLSLSFKSLLHRKFTVSLTIASIALSVALLLGVERIRSEARNSFTQTVSGTDLIVGARTSPVHLLLASVFRLSDATNNIDWESYEAIRSRPEVAWSIPISLGDSHRGYRVLGTNADYLEYLRFGAGRSLALAQGAWFKGDAQAVLGSEVAGALGYGLGAELVVAHGAGEISFVEHDEHPFEVVGVLAATGTPVDQTIHVSLRGLDRIHEEFNQDPRENLDPLLAALAKAEAHDHDHEHHEGCEHAEAGQITAFFLGLHNRSAILGLQRFVNTFEGEALSAVVPALALQELWSMIQVVEKALLAVSLFVVLVGLAGMLVAIMTGLNERRREMAILRSIGARPRQVFALIVGESAVLVGAGIVFGLALFYLLLFVASPLVNDLFGFYISVSRPSLYESGLLGLVFVTGLIFGVLPAWRMLRISLNDGLMLKS